MSVEGYVGKWGDGKTYLLARDGLVAVSDPKCLGVFSTFHIDSETHVLPLETNVKDWTPKVEELVGQWYVEFWTMFNNGGKLFFLPEGNLIDVLPVIRLPKYLVRQGYYAMILIDEINVLLPSRMWNQMPVTMLYAWAQGRKRGLRVRWSSQSEKRVDTVVREVTQFIHESRAKFHFKGKDRPYAFRVRTYYPEDVQAGEATRRRNRVASHWVKRKDQVQSHYDTLEEVEPSAHLQQRIRVRKEAG